MSKQSVCGVMVKVHKLCSSDKYIYSARLLIHVILEAQETHYNWGLASLTRYLKWVV